MKSWFLVALLFSSPVFGNDSLPDVKAPSGFEEGTETHLSAAQISEIEPWAKDSKQRLLDTLEAARTLSPVDAKAELLRGIKQVVLDSGPKRTELLLRVVLNRALKIVERLELGLQKSPVVVLDAQLRVLKLSTNLSLTFYESDLAYLAQIKKEAEKNSKTVTSLPYGKFGQTYASFLMTLNHSMYYAPAQYETAVLAMGLLQWDLYRDTEKRARLSPAISKIHDFLATIPEQAGADDAVSIARRRQILRVYESTALLLNSALEPIKDGYWNPYVDLEPSAIGQESIKAFVETKGRVRMVRVLENSPFLKMDTASLSIGLAEFCYIVPRKEGKSQIVEIKVGQSFPVKDVSWDYGRNDFDSNNDGHFRVHLGAGPIKTIVCYTGMDNISVGEAPGGAASVVKRIYTGGFVLSGPSN